MSPLFLDLLDNERQSVFRKLAAFTPPFVLAGGTAIMLQTGLRKSYDFDCFCEQDLLPVNLLRKVRRVMERVVVRTKSNELLTVTTESGVEITFVCHPYHPLKPVVKTGYISLFSLDDLAANKAYTAGRRPAWRDYVDLFIFMKQGIYSLADIIRLAKKKFAGEFSARLFLGQLTYFDDIEVKEIAFIHEEYSTAEIKSFLSRQVQDYLKTTTS